MRSGRHAGQRSAAPRQAWAARAAWAVCAVLALAAAVVSAVWAAEAGGRGADKTADKSADRMILGVQTHFAYDRTMNAARVIEWIKAARVDSTRDEMFWYDVEDAAGQFGVRNSAIASREAWWSRLPGTAPLLILGYGNPRYDAGGQPRSAAAVAGYARYARWMAGETRDRVRIVELWNEWNLKAGALPAGGAQGGAADYVRMATAAYKELKAADPGLLVLAGGVGEDHPDWRWTREALAAGLLAGADGVSVHLYNHCDRANVGADEMLRRLERLQGLLAAAAKREVPIYLTEVGWPVHNGDCAVSETDAATHTLRLLLQASQRRWLGGVWLYETIDSGDEPGNREHRFGLLRRDGSERPAGCVVRELGAVIAGRPKQVLRQGDTQVALYHDGGRSFVFAWAAEGARGVRLRTRATAAAAPVAAEALPCRLGGGPLAAAGTASGTGAGIELRAELAGARPAVFIVAQPITLEGVQLD